MNDQPERPTGLKLWWHKQPRLRMFWHGFCNPFWPAPPWARGDEAERVRREHLWPLVRQFRREGLIARYGPVGGWWCPNCGSWIEYGDGKHTHDNFVVHRWCS